MDKGNIKTDKPKTFKVHAFPEEAFDNLVRSYPPDEPNTKEPGMIKRLYDTLMSMKWE